MDSRMEVGQEGTQPKPALVERERELAALDGAIARLDAQGGSILIVEGPAGIGKTRLLDEAAIMANRHELNVRRAEGGQFEREVPFSVARQLLEAVIERASENERARLLAGSAELAALAFDTRAEGASGRAADPTAAMRGLFWLLARLADRRPVVLVVDDAQWADSPSLRWLEFLAHRLSDASVLVILGVRSGEPDEPAEIRALRTAGELLSPQPLGAAGVSQLIAAEMGAEAANRLTHACARATGGNPFLLNEVLRTLRTDSIEPAEGAVEAIERLGPPSVGRHVLARLDRFGPDARSLAQAIAILGRAPQPRHVADLAGVDRDRAAAVCDSLREAGILAGGAPIEFVHPLVRSAIGSMIGPSEASVLHRRAAKLQLEGGARPRSVAPHLLACAPDGDQWVVTRLREAAADALTSGVPETAQRYLERALREPPLNPVLVGYELGSATGLTDPEKGARLLAEIADQATDSGLRADAWRDAAVCNLILGDLDESVRASRELVAAAEGDRERTLLAEASLCTLTLLNTGVDGEMPRRIEQVADGLEGKTAGECVVRQALSTVRAVSCAPVTEVIGDALKFPPTADDPSNCTSPLACKALTYAGRWDLTCTVGEMGTERARKSGHLPELTLFAGFLAEALRMGGRLADSEFEARTGLELGAEIGRETINFTQMGTQLMATLIARGELDEAEAMAAERDPSPGPRGRPELPSPLEIRGLLRLEQGRLEEGVSDLLAVGEELEEMRILNPSWSTWRQDVAPALATLGRTAEAFELIDEAETRAQRIGAPHTIGQVLRSRGLIETGARQIETLGKSVAVLETAHAAHELARSLIALGAALRRDNRRSDSREPLRRGLELAHRCGAGGLEARAREELAAAGSRPRSVFRTGIEALTASELRAAKLAAKGLSNLEIADRLFITRKTVEKHLGNAYGKLEISSREELPAALEQPSAAS